MKEFFEKLFAYSHQCNQRLADVIFDNQDLISEKAVKLYSHILNAHQIWNNRIEPKQKVFEVWQIHPIADFEKIDTMNYRNSISLLENCDLNQIVDYKNSKGDSFASHVGDILFHVINHSTYHRAQIATEFRENGIEPLMTDYILFKR
ncbi:damage-inducible protein DinB [Sphingobacterium phlebotomi]|uniref:Damage-inducible protein DinB n=1 Tax=Sphingobacterium phlebotomi TaxID=2605433 RepID=A0A5D4H4C6_9SPHI|nr:DinB family protein [Sphingobacterium phlebotomi]TYR33650.1 damage-inducible protein DinB [Sphingobacterium phlebotomi]